MGVSLVTIAVAMLCAHDVYANVQPQKDFDLQRFSGKWYRVGLAYDSPGFVLYRHKLKISTGVLTPMANGNANMTMWTQRSSGCRCKNYIYEKTDVPGQFNYFSTRHNRMKDITVVETNYNEYALVLKHKKMNREFTQVALYGRSQRLRPQLLEKFREFALALGFPKESILTPLAAEDCPQLSNRHKTDLLQNQNSP